MIVPVIMAGGKGTRLWPLSRTAHPKQFLSLHDDHTMLENTLARLAGLADCLPPLVLCNNEHRFLVAEQLRNVQAGGELLLEPVGRNTAPAVALAALLTRQRHEDATLLVLAADHVILDTAAFQRAVVAAETVASQGYLVTFGIVPKAPVTDYGYILRGERLSSSEADMYEVSGFVEKPDLDTARRYVASGDYYWNSGLFMFHASKYLHELETYRPDIFQACCKAMENQKKDLDFLRIDTEPFVACAAESIDYAVMEQTKDAVVVPLDAGWSDLGSWSSLWEISQPDSRGNILKGDVLTHQVSNTYLRSEHKLIAAVGVDNLIVVNTSDAVLVADKKRVQDVRHIVAQLDRSGREESTFHRKVHRPWGWFDSVDVGERHQVKHLCVNPGAKLSLQMHHHRAEHWIVVKGVARVTRGDEELFLAENQSIYIPLGTKHALENPGVLPVEIIEVQSGSYLGEDDIVRFEDRYERV